MKKQLVIIGIVAILVSVVFSGCNEENNTLTPEKSKFVEHGQIVLLWLLIYSQTDHVHIYQ